MDFFIEVVIFLVSIFFTSVFLIKWYTKLLSSWPQKRIKSTRFIFGWLPIICVAIITYTLKVLASFDVVNDGFYLLFYILLGLVWIYCGLILMSLLFDISWIDDTLNLNNKASLLTLTGGILGITVIYAGANIGDGPGWWCVIFAGGLGLIVWFFLGFIINLITKVFERITVGRDLNCGIRFGFYLFASGIILGRAAAGDWTSFSWTVVEFMDGWVVLPLALIMIMIELYYLNQAKVEHNIEHDNLLSSIFWGLVYVAMAVLSLIYIIPPIKENPIYDLSIWILNGGLK